jgi:hypothetical protein
MQMLRDNDCVDLPFGSCIAVTRRAYLFVWRNGAFTRWLPISQVEDKFDDGTRDWRIGDTGVVRVSRWLFQQAPELKLCATWDHPPLGWCAHCSVKLPDAAMTECPRCHDRVAKIVSIASVKDDDGGPLGEPPRRIQPRRNRLEIVATMRKRGLSVVKAAKTSR